MPALVAMRFNPDLKAKYQAMIKAGKPPKVALTALMRKLIELANVLTKANRLWAINTLDQDGYSKVASDTQIRYPLGCLGVTLFHPKIAPRHAAWCVEFSGPAHLSEHPFAFSSPWETS